MKQRELNKRVKRKTRRRLNKRGGHNNQKITVRGRTTKENIIFNIKNVFKKFQGIIMAPLHVTSNVALFATGLSVALFSLLEIKQIDNIIDPILNVITSTMNKLDSINYEDFFNYTDNTGKVTIKEFFDIISKLDENKVREKLNNLSNDELEAFKTELQRVVKLGSEHNTNLKEFNEGDAIDNLIVFIKFIKENQRGNLVGLDVKNDGKFKLKFRRAANVITAANRIMNTSEKYREEQKEKEEIFSYFNKPQNEKKLLELFTQKLRDEQFIKNNDIPKYLANPETGLSGIAIMMIIHYKLNESKNYDKDNNFYNLFKRHYL
jgi:hypothetical protein